MIKKTLVVALSAFCMAAVLAEPQEPAGMDGRIGAQGADIDMLQARAEFNRLLKAGPTEAEVGDPDSFGRAKTYLGVAQTQQVSLEADCSSFPPDSGVCIELDPAPGAVTSVDESDLAVIELPKKATHSILCFTFTPFSFWNWSNGTVSQQIARMALRPQVRIESEVLDDPSLINPVTGLPFNGVLFDGTITTATQTRTIDPGEFDQQFTVVTRSCTGGLVNPRSLALTYGLTDNQVKQFFKKPITLSFGVRGFVSMVDFASYFVGIRLYGD